MKRFGQAAVIGIAALVVLVIAEAILAAVEVLRPAGRMLAWLLYPGTASVLATGNNRVDDLTFWALALLIDWLLYTLIVFGWLCLGAWRKAGQRVVVPPISPSR